MGGEERDVRRAEQRRVRDRVEANHEYRHRQAAKGKAKREEMVPLSGPASVPPATTLSPALSKSAPAYTEARLKLRMRTGVVVKLFPANTTLSEIAAVIKRENGFSVERFETMLPKKVYNAALDFGRTLKEIGMIPSATLIVI
jgi:hypothetical protein